MTVDKISWGYRADARLEDFLTIEELIKGTKKSKMISIFLQTIMSMRGQTK